MYSGDNNDDNISKVKGNLNPIENDDLFSPTTVLVNKIIKGELDTFELLKSWLTKQFENV